MYSFFNQTNTLEYNGDQLRSQFNYELTKQPGDSIIAFVGAMNVSKDHMVDIEDVVNNDFIYSPKAVNFVIELFDISMEAVALYQLAFMRIIYDNINTFLTYEKNNTPDRTFAYESILLKGDDLFLTSKNEPPKKLSVSIATKSILSGLIHVGLNLTVNDKVPVLAAGLEELFAQEEIDYLIGKIMSDFVTYVADIKNRKVKVKGVI